MKSLATPYALSAGSDGRTLVGPGIKVAWNPKVEDLFGASLKPPKRKQG